MTVVGESRLARLRRLRDAFQEQCYCDIAFDGLCRFCCAFLEQAKEDVPLLLDLAGAAQRERSAGCGCTACDGDIQDALQALEAEEKTNG